LFRRLPEVALAILILASLPSCTSSGSGARGGGDAVASRSVNYTCDDDQQIRAIYIEYAGGSATFVVLQWNGNDYGLARALSASGARYASLYGPTPNDNGLEWWEAKGEARLGTFTGENFTDTRPLLTGCRPQR
jgi:membrane-bound inhibitor of C-type lysozyme